MRDESEIEDKGSSPVGRGGAGVYIEGELGAFYLLTMLAGGEGRGLPGARIDRVQFQGADEGFALDDIIVHGSHPAGVCLLEIQSKRSISFAPKDKVFREVCLQISRSKAKNGVADENHLFAVATQRVSRQIAGPYQDVIRWALAAKSAKAFFERLAKKGVASLEMRQFAAAFRANLAEGIADDHEAVWRLLKRFRILPFDFESTDPLARTYALHIAGSVLAPEDCGRASTLWSVLIEISLATAKEGGSVDRDGLKAELSKRGFRLTGDRDFGPARARLEEMARFALADIGTEIAGFQLPRHRLLAETELARATSRLVVIHGGPGVGKSSILRLLAERTLAESRAIILDPLGTPSGGWSALAALLQVPGTAHDFLFDLATSGGATLFIDSLEMFDDPARQRTVNDLLRTASKIEGFSIVATSRSDFQYDKEWLAGDAIAEFGPAARVDIGELEASEVELLSEQAPELRILLSAGHPAADIARNLYRLSRLLKVNDPAAIRTEAGLARIWWESCDGAASKDVTPARRLLADLADAALAGRDELPCREDIPARRHLLRSLTLREPRRDHLSFYHDVLRDWAVGLRIDEEPCLLDRLDLTRPVPQSLVRGVEFAGRLALEGRDGPEAWLKLLERLSAAHGSWRRQALLAILRSELSPLLLDQHNELLLARGGALLNELANAVLAVDTISAADFIKAAAERNGESLAAELPPALRMAITVGPRRLLNHILRHKQTLPIQAIGAAVRLVGAQISLWGVALQREEKIAEMLYDWLFQLDVAGQESAIPVDPVVEPLDRSSCSRLVQDLRTACLLLATSAPDRASAYLHAVAAEKDDYKVKEIRPFSRTLAAAAPEALSGLIDSSLRESEREDEYPRSSHRRALGHADLDYMPASPAQGPFLDLLEASPRIGLVLIRRLVERAVAFHSRGKAAETNGFTLLFDDGPRFFPWLDTYDWPRGQAPEYSVMSALMALEAWGHKRLDAGEEMDPVLADTLGSEGSCAAFLMVAVDLLISHWPKSRKAAIPFVSCPELLSAERRRTLTEGLGLDFPGFQKEPDGPVKLKDLRARPSRGIPLERLLMGYLDADENSEAVKERLAKAVERLGPYGEDSDFGDPAFMGAYALNSVDLANWVPVENGLAYHSPPQEAEHLERLQKRGADSTRSAEMGAAIHMLSADPSKGSAEQARRIAAFAAEAAEEAEEDERLKATRRAASAMIAARDGDEDLLEERQSWLRETIEIGLAEEMDSLAGQSRLEFSPPALAACALIYLWRRGGQSADRDRWLALATREDRILLPALAAAFDAVADTDPRMIKSAVRLGLWASRWRWHAWDEEASVTEAHKSEQLAEAAKAVEAEIAWLDGGAEPAWPALPDEQPRVRRPLRVGRPAAAEKARRSKAVIRPDDKTASRWIGLAAYQPDSQVPWKRELAHAYSDWSARRNGFGLAEDVELGESPMEWNDQYYPLLAPHLLEAEEQRFEHLLGEIDGLPDSTFCDVAEPLIHAADVWYFNDPSRPADRPRRLRARLAERALRLRFWNSPRNPGDLNFDRMTGGFVARMFANTHNPFGETTTYLVPGVLDRIDPLLDPLRPLLPGGPTPLIAHCVMNMVEVAPRARHADFLVDAVENWLDWGKKDPTLWIELGIGRRFVVWLEKAATDDPTLLAQAHPLRQRIDACLGRLVALGIAEAYALEQRIEGERLALGRS